MEDGWMGRNIAPKMLHVLVGYVLGAWVAHASKCTLGNTTKTWHVLVGGRFKVLVSKVMFCGAWFLTSRNEHWATTEIWHVFVAVCFRGPIAHVWKLNTEPPCSKQHIYDLLLKYCWGDAKGGKGWLILQKHDHGCR